MRPYIHNVIYFAKTNYRNERKVFGVYRHDKLYHTLVVGKTGTGKTSLLETKILQEIYHGQGSVIVFDPNGDLIQSILEKYPTHRTKDLIVIDPSDSLNGYGYNPIKKVKDELKPILVSGIIEILQKIYGASWGARIEHILRFALYTLVAQKAANLSDISKLLIDEHFRNRCLKEIKNKQIIQFWLGEFPKYRADALLPILSKLQSFVINPAVKSALISPWRDISFRRAMDTKKVILISLSKGKLGSDVASFIGSFFITSISLAAHSRANVLEWERPYTSIYLDEFQNYTTPTLISAFSELRKYKIAFTVATQYLSALKPEIRDSILGNAGSLITFRVSIDEARYLAKYLYPKFTAEQIVGLPNYHILLTLMINGVPSPPFSAITQRYSDIYYEKIRPNNQDKNVI